MTVSELRHHLENIQRAYGDIEVRVDADIFRDSMPRDVTSLSVAAFYVQPVGDIVIGQFPREGVTRAVIYCGNEPKLQMKGAK